MTEQTTNYFPDSMGPIRDGDVCELCAEQSEHRPAVGRTINPDFSGYKLCQSCVDHYDSLFEVR